MKPVGEDDKLLMEQLEQIMKNVKHIRNKALHNGFMQQVADLVNYKVENGRVSAADGIAFTEQFVKRWNEL